MVGKSTAIWHLYILECEDGSFYTGISPDPQKRFEAHRGGKGARYTKMHKPVRILVTEVVGSYELALRREYQVKRQQKPGKLKYIVNPSSLPMPALSDRWRNRPPAKAKAKRKPRIRRKKAV
jgi:putative endonuclease